MKNFAYKEHLTPLHHAVANSLKNPLRIAFAIIFLLMAVVVSLIDFLVGCFILPIAIFEFTAILISIHKAKNQTGKFGLKCLVASSVFALVISALFAVLKTLQKYDIFEIPEVFSLTFDEFSIPVNLFNSKFLNPELFMISFVVLVISNLFYLGALDKILAKNLPKICGFITSIIFSFLSIIALVFDILIRTQALPFTYQSSDTLLTYILLGVCTFLIACAILQMASAFYSIFKTRK